MNKLLAADRSTAAQLRTLRKEINAAYAEAKDTGVYDTTGR